MIISYKNNSKPITSSHFHDCDLYKKQIKCYWSTHCNFQVYKMNVLVGYGTQVRIAWKQLRPPNQNTLNGATCVDPINANPWDLYGSIYFICIFSWPKCYGLVWCSTWRTFVLVNYYIYNMIIHNQSHIMPNLCFVSQSWVQPKLIVNVNRFRFFFL